MKDFFSQHLFTIQQNTITPAILAGSLLIIILAVVLTLIVRSKKRKNRYLATIIWVIALFVVLSLLGVNLKKTFSWTLIDTKDFTLSLWDLILVVLILLLTRLAVTGLKKLFSRAFEEKHLDRRKTVPFLNVISYTIWVIAILIALKSIGLNMSILLGAGAALLVGVGFGLQHIIADIISGILLWFEGNLKVDDVVELKNGIIGKVLEIGLRSSKIQTRDDIVMIVPNSKFVVDEIINWSHMDIHTRFYVQVGVAYGSDIRKVEKLLLDCALKHPDVSRKQKPFVRFIDFGNSSLDFQLFFWTVKVFRVENIKSDLRFAIDQAFHENQITIPFPQQDVHLFQPES